MAAPERTSVDATRCVSAFEAQFDFVYRSLRRQGVSDCDAEDLTQEVLIVMWRRWTDYDPARPLRPWLAGIVARVARRHRLRRKPEELRAWVDEVDPAPDLDEQLGRRRQRALALRALASLSDDQRFVLVLHDLEGETLDRIARHLEMPRSTVFSRLRAARSRFARAVRRLGSMAAAAGGNPPTPSAVMAAERAASAAPVVVRERALDRARSIVLLPAWSHRAELEPRWAPRPWWSWTVVSAAALSVCCFLLVTRSREGEKPPLGGAAQSGLTTRSEPQEVRQGRRHLLPAFAAPIELRTPRARSPWSQSLARGLVGHWRLDDGEGAVAADRSGHHNDCKRRVRSSGSRGADAAPASKSLRNDSWLECPVSESLARPGAEMTMAARIRRTMERRGVQTLLARQQPDSTADDFFLGIFNHGPQRDELVLNSRAWMVRVNTDLPPPSGRWSHLAATHAADGITRLFIDGVEKASKSALRPGALLSGSKPFLVGGGANALDPERVEQLFEGQIVDLLIYDRELGEDEVAALAAGHLPDPGR